LLIALLLAIATVSCGSAGPTPAEVRASCERDPKATCCGDDDCAADSVCHFDFSCALGSNHVARCGGPMTGDRQCHPRCDATRPCAGGLTCQTVTVYGGSDVGHEVSMCAAR
jgi:hypothetical protein